MNAFKQEEDSVAFKFFQFLYIKYTDEFLHKWINDLRKAINAHQVCWRPLKNNFQKLFEVYSKNNF